MLGIISPGEPFHIVKAGADWLISWRALRKDGVALMGPPIQCLIDPITTDDFLDAVAEHIYRYRESVTKPHNKQALAYIVLTVARGVYTLHHREDASKAVAAAWAEGRFPRWVELIRGALRWRADPASDCLASEQIAPDAAAYVHDMLSQLPPATVDAVLDSSGGAEPCIR